MLFSHTHTQIHQRFAQCVWGYCVSHTHTTFFGSVVVGLLVVNVRCHTCRHKHRRTPTDTQCTTHTQAQTQAHTHRHTAYHTHADTNTETPPQRAPTPTEKTKWAKPHCTAYHTHAYNTCRHGKVPARVNPWKGSGRSSAFQLTLLRNGSRCAGVKCKSLNWYILLRNKANFKKWLCPVISQKKVLCKVKTNKKKHQWKALNQPPNYKITEVLPMFRRVILCSLFWLNRAMPNDTSIPFSIRSWGTPTVPILFKMQKQIKNIKKYRFCFFWSEKEREREVETR